MPLFRAVGKVPLSLLLKQFALIYLFAAAVLTAAIVASIRLDTQDRLERAGVREAARVEIARSLVAKDFSLVTSDVRLLAEMPSLRRYLDNGSGAHKEELANLLRHVASTTRRYDQVRYLDATGREVVRVNYAAGKASIVPRGQLQDKSGRYFFRDTIKLDRNEVFVSPLDLNIEHDRLEIPYKPMIRFGTPVFDSAGRKRGIILLNYFGEELLQHFRAVLLGGDQRSGMLLNSDGYWLSSAKREDEWGFMLGKPERAFGHEFAEEWRTISAGESGALQTKNGLFVYATVYPLQEGQRSSTGSALPHSASRRELAGFEYNWKIVSHVSDENISKFASGKERGSRILIAVAYLLLALGSLAIAYFNLGRRQVRLKIKEDEARLREITATMSDGLLVTDANGMITFANPEACVLLGYGQNELAAADMHGLLHVEEDGTPCPRVDCKLLQVVQTGKTYRGAEEYFKRKDGELLPISVSVSAIVREQQAAGIVVAFHDITERKKFQLELERRAQVDVLTGLNNRRHFYELAELEIERTRRYGKPLAVLMLDADHFKHINDSHGHHVGDAVLQKLGAVCRHTMREIDIVGRLGGEEFAILLPEVTTAQAQEAAERLRKAVTAAAVPTQGESVFFTVSIGVTGLAETDRDIVTLLKRADAAMYDAKQAGRNRVCVRE
ncbi:MAG: diguanylate cyclase [Nitrosomonadales bacterium]|nr:diguanylate cyclase [Nitrosomonadales bacterium]